MIRNVLVLGAGSAGLLAAISLKIRLPSLVVRVVRSPSIGVIGVGEGTTPTVPTHLFDYLGITRKFFYASARPTWKVGVRLLWGKRHHFHFPLLREFDQQRADLSMPNGYYCHDDCSSIGQLSALLECDKVFVRNPDGSPDVHGGIGFHIENKKLVDTLEQITRSLAIEIIDANVSGATRGPDGIQAVALEDGRHLEADFFIDASGFRSELLGKTLQEPFASFGRTLFCDRAVVGGWPRTTEPILPYTTAETMDAGWCWQIEHEEFVNRGYVFSSAFLSDEQAVEEFRRKNPKVGPAPRVVKFRTGRYQRCWIENVVAIGNSAGFVEPLEATALMIVCAQCQTLCNLLQQSRLEPTPTMRLFFNNFFAAGWDEIRDFLGLHYKLNNRIDNPFWRHCVHETDLSAIQDLMDFYAENGPSLLCRQFLKTSSQSPFGADGFIVMFVGFQAPYSHVFHPSSAEKAIWENRRAALRAKGATGLSVKEALSYIHHPGWQWHGDAHPQGPTGEPIPSLGGMGLRA